MHELAKTQAELEEVLENIANIYERTREETIELILKWPQFAGYDHEHVVREATQVYGNEEAVITAILKFPQFAALNHARVVQEATQIYGDQELVKKAILKHPQFAGLDHTRIMRQRSRLGNIIGIHRQQVIEYILNNPVLAGYSAKRYLAGLDCARCLAAEGFEWDHTMLNAFISYVFSSPYVPGTNRQRISHVPNAQQEPPLLTAMRNYLRRAEQRQTN